METFDLDLDLDPDALLFDFLDLVDLVDLFDFLDREEARLLDLANCFLPLVSAGSSITMTAGCPSTSSSFAS